jgi:hypothetical protein
LAMVSSPLTTASGPVHRACWTSMMSRAVVMGGCLGVGEVR